MSKLLRRLLGRSRLDAEMTEEMRVHLEMQAERNRAAGMSADEARYAALRQFGNVVSVQERAREERRWMWWEQLRQDLGHAWGGLGRTPVFSFSVVLILALGIGPVTAILSLLQQTLLRSGDFPPHLFAVCRQTNGSLNPILSDYMIRGYERSPAIAESAKIGFMGGNVAIDGQPSGNRWCEISPNLLGMLNVTPALGRDFLHREGQPGADAVVIISDLSGGGISPRTPTSWAGRSGSGSICVR